jgi:hypothetical protein
LLCLRIVEDFRGQREAAREAEAATSRPHGQRQEGAEDPAEQTEAEAAQDKKCQTCLHLAQCKDKIYMYKRITETIIIDQHRRVRYKILSWKKELLQLK